eukprot:scaffold80860_cov51-Phaeocystis_antarctica.AAC.2
MAARRARGRCGGASRSRRGRARPADPRGHRACRPAAARTRPGPCGRPPAVVVPSPPPADLLPQGAGEGKQRTYAGQR